MDPAFFACSSSSESEEGENINIIRKKIRCTMDPLSLSNSDFKKRFRLTKDAFNYLLHELDFEGHLSTKVPRKIQLAATLSLLATGGFQHSVGNDFLIGVSQSCLCKIIKQVVDEMERKLCIQYIKFVPRNSDECKEYFMGKYNIPGVIGCVDGTHFGLQKPPNEHMFFNRKGFHSLNSMIVPILVDLRNLNKKKLRKSLENYLGFSITGWIVSYSTIVSICTLRYIFGRFYWYTLTFLPAVLGASLSYLGPAHVVNILEISTFQCTIESFFLKQRNFISRSVANSRVLQTGLFMLCSAIILFGKQIYNIKGFWISVPNPRLTLSENTEHQKCKLHPQTTCKQYLFDGMSKYFILGLTMDLIKILTSKTLTSETQTKFMGKLRNFRIHSMALLTGYIGIYRFIHCWLNHKGFYPDLCNHNLSSFLAGSIYYYYPQTNLLSYALVQAIRSLWSIFEATNQNTKNKILKFILNIPYGRLLFPLGMGHLLTLAVFQPQCTNSLTATIFNKLAYNTPKDVSNKINNIRKLYNNK